MGVLVEWPTGANIPASPIQSTKCDISDVSDISDIKKETPLTSQIDNVTPSIGELTIETFLSQLEQHGISLRLGESSQQLKADAPIGAMTEELRAAIAANKEALITLILEREERAALQGAPDGCEAALWLSVINNPQIQKALKLFKAEIIEIRRPQPSAGPSWRRKQ